MGAKRRPRKSTQSEEEAEDEIAPEDSISCVSSTKDSAPGRAAKRRKSDAPVSKMPPPTRTLKLGMSNPAKGGGRGQRGRASSSKDRKKADNVATCGNCGASITDEEVQWPECVNSSGEVERIGFACQKCFDGYKIHEGAKADPEEQVDWPDFVMQRKNDPKYKSSTDECISAAGQRLVGNSEIIEVEDAGFECFRDYEMVAPGDVDEELSKEVMPETRVCFLLFFRIILARRQIHLSVQQYLHQTYTYATIGGTPDRMPPPLVLTLHLTTLSCDRGPDHAAPRTPAPAHPLRLRLPPAPVIRTHGER